MESKIKAKGHYLVEHLRGGRVIGSFQVDNLITENGLDKMLDVMFHGTAAISPWYMGLINNAGFTAIAATDTHDTHPGWVEFTNYAEATREVWPEDAASGQAITNTTLMEYNINATGQIKGAYLSNLSAKGSVAAGTLWNATAFSSVLNVINGDVLRLTYTVSLS